MERVLFFLIDLFGCISRVNSGFEIKLTGLCACLFVFRNQSAVMFVVIMDLYYNCRHLWLLRMLHKFNCWLVIAYIRCPNYTDHCCSCHTVSERMNVPYFNT